ncbi:MAG: hypothetical protein ACHP7N_10610 [Caulobacterales bacterium]
MPAAVLAEAAFRAYSRKIVEARRTGLANGAGGQLSMLLFATKTRSAGDPGVCEAEVFMFLMGSKPDNLPAKRPFQMDMYTMYHVIGPTDVSLSKARQRADERTCSRQHEAWNFIRASNVNDVPAAAQLVNYVRDELKSRNDAQYLDMQPAYIIDVESRRCEPQLIDNRTDCMGVLMRDPTLDAFGVHGGSILTAMVRTDFAHHKSTTKVLAFQLERTMGPVDPFPGGFTEEPSAAVTSSHSLPELRP